MISLAIINYNFYNFVKLNKGFTPLNNSRARNSARFIIPNFKSSRLVTKNLTGFTIIELLVVIVVIGILATLAVISISNVRQKAKDARRVSDIKQIRTALELYKSQKDVYPSTLNDLKDSNNVIMSLVPDNPDNGAYGSDSVCTGGSYEYNKVGDSYTIKYCLAGKVSEIPAGWCIATPDTMCSPPPPPSPFGSGTDGNLIVNSVNTYNVNTQNNPATTRTCSDGGDAVGYKVSGISGSMVTIDTTYLSGIGAGCLVAGDEVLIIDLQGALGDIANVGKYEFAKVVSVSGAQITLESAPSMVYGSSQKILIQRVPQYENLTVDGTLTANAWHGGADWFNQPGGVVAFRVHGILSGSGKIDMSGKGYAGGPYANPPNVNYASDPGEGLIGGSVSTNGYSIVDSYCTYQENIGGGGGGQHAQYYAGDGGGGGGYANNGDTGEKDTSGSDSGSWTCNCVFAGHSLPVCYRYPGVGGYAYGQANLNTIFMGAGGGAGGRDEGTAFGDTGGNGGGIILTYADIVSGSLLFLSDGKKGTEYGDGLSGGGAGGGAGGSILVKAKQISSATTLNSNGGPKTITSGSNYGGNGGDGSVGRIAIYDCDSYFGGDSWPVVYVGALTGTDCSAPFSPISQCKFTPGPIAYWKFDGDYTNDGSTALGTPSTVSVTYDPSDSKRGQSAVFNSLSNSHIDYGNVLNLGTNSRTVTFWMKTNSNTAGIIGKAFYGNSSGRWWVSTDYSAPPPAPQGMAGGIQSQDLSKVINPRVTGAYNDNTWHFVSIVWKRNGSLSYYLDNAVRMSTQDISSFSLDNLSNGNAFLIGAYGNTSGQCCQSGYYLNGKLDEVQIYNRALSSNEISALYNAYQNNCQ